MADIVIDQNAFQNIDFEESFRPVMSIRINLLLLPIFRRPIQ